MRCSCGANLFVIIMAIVVIILDEALGNEIKRETAARRGGNKGVVRYNRSFW